MPIRTAAVAALAASVLSAPALAQPITDSFVYQGELMDNGEPANGVYDFLFTVLDAEVGGSIVVGGNTQAQDVVVTDGRFECFVNYGVTGFVFDTDQTRWLRVSVAPDGGAFTALSPVTRIAPAPYANYALRSGSSLQDAYDNGRNISAISGAVGITANPGFEAELKLGSSSGTSARGRLAVFNDLGEPTIELNSNNPEDDGMLTIRNANGVDMIDFQNDASIGGGGLIQIANNDSGVVGALLQGNFFGTESGALNLLGSDSSIQLRTDISGNSSVLFPLSSISDSEIEDEPGVSESQLTSQIIFTNDSATVDTIDSVTINAPAPGFVLVIGSTELTITHANGSTSSVNIGVSQSPGVLTGNSDLETRINAANPSGSSDFAVTAHGLFQVSTGSNTFYLLGDKSTGSYNASALDSQLTAVYLPTSYGTVLREHTQDTPDEFAPVRGPKTSIEVLAEQNAALQADNERQQHELEAMHARVRAIEESLSNTRE